MSKIENSLSEFQFQAFGKVKRKSIIEKKGVDNQNEELLKAQREKIESDFKPINEISSLRGKTSAMFDVLNRVRRSKNNLQNQLQ